jgi:hypothetical protein
LIQVQSLANHQEQRKTMKKPETMRVIGTAGDERV